MGTVETEAFLLVDPVQDYEETLTILGVYGSLDAAKEALARLREVLVREVGIYGHSKLRRDSEVQHWRGDQLLESWTYTPPESKDPDVGWSDAWRWGNA
ncbi:hypothetical protein [Microbacterium halotolerans]|uniref:hypothetical protein n=1 Tax=Microbacterium halotolerans TaxID=246613 RepID=UPI000E6AC059|nr:hypothetical protein [Microbacterium halotolerans]